MCDLTLYAPVFSPEVGRMLLQCVLQLCMCGVYICVRVVSQAIQPPKEEGGGEGVVQLVLEKASTQEEFIPGTMGSAPYK